MGRLHLACRLLALAAAAGATLALPSTAGAETPPVLAAPTNGSSLVAGSQITFRWSGALQGDADAISRSFFLVQVMPASAVPAGRDALWPTPSNEVQTTPGVQTGSASFGAPDSGRYSWRVCAIGVRDVTLSNTLEQLACSDTVNLTTTAAAAGSSSDPSVLTLSHSHVTQGPDRHVQQVRPVPQPRIVYLTKPGAQGVTFDVNSIKGVFGGGRRSSVSLARTNLTTGSGNSGALGGVGQLGGSVLSGLSWNIPGVSVPFWTLLLLLVPLPLSIWWRKTALTMFDMPTSADAIADAGALPDLYEDDPGFKPPGDDADARAMPSLAAQPLDRSAA